MSLLAEQDWQQKARLPEDRQRRLYDAFHLELRYDHITGELSAVIVTRRLAAVEAIGNATNVRAEALRARGGIRTRTLFRAADFKSAVSAIPPPGRDAYRCEPGGPGNVGTIQR